MQRFREALQLNIKRRIFKLLKQAAFILPPYAPVCFHTDEESPPFYTILDGSRTLATVPAAAR